MQQCGPSEQLIQAKVTIFNVTSQVSHRVELENEATMGLLKFIDAAPKQLKYYSFTFATVSLTLAC